VVTIPKTAILSMRNSRLAHWETRFNLERVLDFDLEEEPALPLALAVLYEMSVPLVLSADVELSLIIGHSNHPRTPSWTILTRNLGILNHENDPITPFTFVRQSFAPKREPKKISNKNGDP
jgi:hypothetical protein